MKDNSKRIAMQQQALENATNGESIANYEAIIKGFMRKGIAQADISPRENVLTFHAWKALGRSVKKGEHGVKVVTFIECTKKDDETGNKIPVKKCKQTTVFHINQTEPIEEKAEAQKTEALPCSSKKELPNLTFQKEQKMAVENGTTKKIENTKKEFIKLLHENSNMRRPWQAFQDFCEIFALAFSNTVDKLQFQEREARYFTIIKNYDKDEIARFVGMRECLEAHFEQHSFCDLLGEIYMELNFYNENSGQFFSPYALAQCMASITIKDAKNVIAENGFITVNDPACGSGVMLIAVADYLHSMGINPQKALHIVAQDLDITCVHMVYIQLNLWGIPAIVEQRNTLTNELYSTWYTVFHVLDGWDKKLSSKIAENAALTMLNEIPEPPQETEQEQEAEKPIFIQKPLDTNGQLGLF